MIHISEGNSKLGGIPSVSLPPGLSCRPGVLCLKDCYARNICNRFGIVKLQWNENFRIYKEDPIRYFSQIDEFLETRRPRHFRWHVGGDCPDDKYFDHVELTAIRYPDVRFLMFTKVERYLLRGLEPNLYVVFSEWPYHPMSKGSHSRSWVRADLRAPKDAFQCTGRCIDCLHCFTKRGTNIVFKPH